MSSVPEVLAALSTLGRTALPNSQVVDGTLPPGTTGRLLLIGDEDFDVEREPDSAGGTTATERYIVPCAIAADLQTPEQSIADAQAWADFEVIENALEATPDLGLSPALSLSAMVVNVVFRRLADADGRHALVRFGVDIYAANN